MTRGFRRPQNPRAAETAGHNTGGDCKTMQWVPYRQVETGLSRSFYVIGAAIELCADQAGGVGLCRVSSPHATG
jgi:hypothetical protein